MDIKAAFPGSFLKAADLQGRRVNVGIDRVTLEEVGGEHKPVIYFIGKERGLVLNKTNGNIIAEMYGTETDNWHGCVITLYPAKVEFQGNIVAAIRVHLDPMAGMSAQAQAPDPAPAPAPRQMATPRNQPVNGKPPSAPVMDDEIPF
jgi:hypothetical protein